MAAAAKEQPVGFAHTDTTNNGNDENNEWFRIITQYCVYN